MSSGVWYDRPTAGCWRPSAEPEPRMGGGCYDMFGNWRWGPCRSGFPWLWSSGRHHGYYRGYRGHRGHSGHHRSSSSGRRRHRGGFEDPNMMAGGFEDPNMMAGGFEDQNMMGGGFEDQNMMAGGFEDQNMFGGGFEDPNMMAGGYDHLMMQPVPLHQQQYQPIAAATQAKTGGGGMQFMVGNSRAFPPHALLRSAGCGNCIPPPHKPTRKTRKQK